jgi:hypothetical protein
MRKGDSAGQATPFGKARQKLGHLMLSVEVAGRLRRFGCFEAQQRFPKRAARGEPDGGQFVDRKTGQRRMEDGEQRDILERIVEHLEQA